MRLPRMKRVKLNFNGLWLLPVTWLMVNGAVLISAVTLLPASAQAQTVDGRRVEADRLLQQGIQQTQNGQYQTAIQSFEQALIIYRQVKHQPGEGAALIGLGTANLGLGNSPKAVELLQQALALAQKLNNPEIEKLARQFLEVAQQKTEADRLVQQGVQQIQSSQNQAASQSFGQALMIYRQIKHQPGVGAALIGLGTATLGLGNSAKALELSQQAIAIAQELKSSEMEKLARQVLEAAQKTANSPVPASSQKTEADHLLQQGFQQFNVSQFTAALQSWQQALQIYREIKDRQSEGNALGNLGEAYRNLGNYAKAIEYQEQSLAIAREIKDRQSEGHALGNLGIAYYSLGNYAKAIEYEQQDLVIARAIKDRQGEGAALGSLGLAYLHLGNYAKAIEYQQQHLAIAREIKDRRSEGKALGNLGIAYYSLGNYAKAIEYEQQWLTIAREIKDRQSEGKALGGLGIAYQSLGNYAKAIEYQQQHLAIAREIKDRQSEGTALGNLGNAYQSLGNYAKAIEYEQQWLAITREIKDRQGEGAALGNLGIAYYSLGNYAKAIEYHQQLLAITREIKDRESEGIGLNNLGATLAKQQQPELAIIFYKQSVSVREAIRGDIRTLPRESQESYTQTVAGTYRALADLLLAQGRVLEAQQALELLKIQELRNYTRDTRAGGKTQGAPLNAIEAPVIPPFNNLIALGLKLTTCESQKPYCSERDQLRRQRDQATTYFNQQADRLRTLARQGRDKDPAQLQQEELTVAAYKVVQAQPHTVLIYPLVLEDRLWLVYGLQAGKQGVVFASKEIPVSRKDLAATVTQFRQLLENPNSDLKQLQQVSQKLYGWLVAPLRPQLDANGIQNLVFSLDRSTRYLPLAALYDGNQYLVQRFSLSTILTAGLTDTHDKLSPKLADNPILGLGLSNAAAGFPALPNVISELDAIVHTKKPDSQGIFPGTERLNSDFTLNAFKDILDYRILHLATHGKFVSENPEDSFLVLGDGNLLKVTDIKKMNDLGGIHLVVLSACETAQGGPDKEGIEVSGLSYYFLTQNVKSVMASLWKVNDASTSRLMQQFYKNWATGKMSKVEALQQAQLAMIQGKGSGVKGDDRPSVGDHRGNFKIETPPAITRSLSHPFYWAPFILICNGL